MEILIIRKYWCYNYSFINLLISRDVAVSCSKEMFANETDRFITVDSHSSSVSCRSQLQYDSITARLLWGYPFCFTADISQMTGISSILRVAKAQIY